MSRLTALNIRSFMGVEVVQIEPDGTLQIIQGANGAGKSTVLTAIWALLASKAGLKDVSRPVKDGAERAILEGTITDDDGNAMRITRVIDASGKMTVKITNADGSISYNSPETMLKKLFTTISFDPLAFARMKPKEQVEFYLRAIETDFDLSELNVQRSELYDQRTQANRDRTSAAKALESIPEVEVDADAEEVSAASILAEQEHAHELLISFNRVRAAADEADEARHAADAEVDRLRLLLSEATLEANRLADDARSALKLADALPDDPDFSVFAERIAQVEQTNAQIRIARQRRALEEQRDEQQSIVARLEQGMDDIDNRKRDAIAAVPELVPELTFDEEQMLYRGRPLQQASGSEQLLVSLRVGAALSPELRVMCLQDGPLLDADNMKLLAEFAETHDFQCFVERVGTGEVGITIEAGRVVDGSILSDEDLGLHDEVVDDAELDREDASMFPGGTMVIDAGMDIDAIAEAEGI